MKYKHKLEKLAGRIKYWESLPKNPTGAYMKPGSEHK